VIRILLINHYAGSPTHGMEFRPFYFAREWIRSGHQVRVLSASFSHLRSRNPRFRGFIMHETLDGVPYRWLRTPSYRGNGIGRVFNMLVFTAWLCLLIPWFGFVRRPRIVIASSTYPLDVFPAWMIARLAGAKLVFEVHDLWPLSPVELSGMSRWHPFILAMQVAENFAYRACDVCVSMLPKALDHMRNHGLKPRKFKYVPNGILPEEWDQQRGEVPTAHVEALAKFRKEHPFLLGYVGTHGLANAL
jgi:glycosyltransferase involved in cell wall biosynthesis